MSRWPKTRAEWQEAVDSAAACRAIADCKMYGLLVGGPTINIQRCDAILEAGARQGIVPSKSSQQLAVEMAGEINAAAAARTTGSPRLKPLRKNATP